MSWYEKHTEKQLRGRKVRVLSELRNGREIVPVGAVGTITKKFDGLWVDFEKCPHCGVQPRLARIGASALELLPAEVRS